MKPTNDRAIIRLMHMPTGTYTDWAMSRHAVPSVHYLEKRAGKVRAQMDAWMQKEGIKRGDIQARSLSAEQLDQMSSFNEQIMALEMDALACVLEPRGELPEGYPGKREYLEECVPGYEVIQEIMDFFWEHFGSSISSAGDSRPTLQILDEAGNPWHSPNTKASAPKTSSSG